MLPFINIYNCLISVTHTYFDLITSIVCSAQLHRVITLMYKKRCKIPRQRYMIVAAYFKIFCTNIVWAKGNHPSTSLYFFFFFAICMLTSDCIMNRCAIVFRSALLERNGEREKGAVYKKEIIRSAKRRSSFFSLARDIFPSLLSAEFLSHCH